MHYRQLGLRHLITAGIALASLAAAPACNGSKTPEPGKPGSTTAKNGDSAPRLSDGQPDMQGLYVPNWRSTVAVERWTAAERKEYADLLVKIRGANTGAGPGGDDIESDLQGEKTPPDTVMVEDLASVELDVAALQHGYQRPSGAGHPLEITVTDTGATRRFFAWSS